MATELSKIFVDEVSGVDIPANLTPGWLMQKSANLENVANATAAEIAAEMAKELPPRHPDGSGRFHRPTGTGPSKSDIRDILGGGKDAQPSDPVTKSDGLGLFRWSAGQSGVRSNTIHNGGTNQ